MRQFPGGNEENHEKLARIPDLRAEILLNSGRPKREAGLLTPRRRRSVFVAVVAIIIIMITTSSNLVIMLKCLSHVASVRHHKLGCSLIDNELYEADVRTRETELARRHGNRLLAIRCSSPATT
jgi:hypothetical protein